MNRSAAHSPASHKHRREAADGRLPRLSRRARIAISWTAAAAMAALIFFVSAKSGVDLDQNSGLLSAAKAWLAARAADALGRAVDVSPIGHFCEYLAFGALLANALRLHMPHGRALVCAVILASAYGVTDEVHQLFVPMRSCDPADWAVDTVAAAVGALAFSFIAARKRRADSPSR